MTATRRNRQAISTTCVWSTRLVFPFTVIFAISFCASFAGAAKIDSGQVLGRVFFDLDDSGDWSDGDEGVEGARILTDRAMEVFTGPDGRYHVSQIVAGREVLSGRILVLDRSRLPAGTIVKGGWRRLVQIPPSGLPVRVDFLLSRRIVDLAKLKTMDLGHIHAGILMPTQDGGVRTLLSGLVPAGCMLGVDGQALHLGRDRKFSLWIKVNRGVNQHLFTLQCADGGVHFLLEEVHRIARSRGGDLVISTMPKRLAVCSGPDFRQVPKTSAISLNCLVEKGVELQIQDKRGKVVSPGAALSRYFSILVEAGENHVPVGVKLPDGKMLSGSVDWKVDKTHLLGSLYGVAAFGLEGTDKLFAGGHLGGYMEWSLPEGFKLIIGSGFDSFDIEGRTAKEIVVNVLRPEDYEGRFQRDVDPEYSWIEHSDESRVHDINPTGSKYLLKLARKNSFMGWGAFTTDDAAEEQVGRWRRTLNGGHGVFRPLEDFMDSKNLDIKLEGFWVPTDDDLSSTRALPAHEEFLATGGTLYFLGHDFVREGSERVVAQRRDMRTGLVMSARRLSRGVEYQIDWTSGRIMLTEPLDKSSMGPLRISPDGQYATVLVVEYEFSDIQGSGTEGDSMGGAIEVRGTPFEGLRLGGRFGALKSGLGPDDYSLMSTEVHVSVGAHSRAWARWATSNGIALQQAYSVDGGITQFGLETPMRNQGEAYEAGVVLDFSKIKARVMGRRFLTGFSDSSYLALCDVNQAVAFASAQLADGLTLTGRVGGLGMWSGDLFNAGLGLTWRVLPSLEMALQGAYEGAFSSGSSDPMGKFEEVFGQGQGLLLGAKGTWRINKAFSVLASHQQSIWSTGTGRSSGDLTISMLGTQVSLWKDFFLGLEAGWGPETGTLLGLGFNTSRNPDASVFAHTTMSVDRSGLTGGWFTGGQNGVAKNGWVVSSTQTMQNFHATQSLGQRTAFRVPVSRSVRLTFAYERSELHEALNDRLRREMFLAPFFHQGIVLSAPSRRNAVFGRLAWFGGKFALSAAAEYRADEHLPRSDFQQLKTLPAETLHQTVLRFVAKWAPVDGLAFSGRLAWAETMEALEESQRTTSPSGGFLEGSVGAAWRPANLDWLRLILRAAVVRDQRPGNFTTSQPEIGQETYFSSSLAAAFYPTKYFQPTVVIAPWFSQFDFRDHRDAIHDSGFIGMLRIGSEFWAGLGMSVELRSAMGARDFTSLPQADDDFRVGFAGEIFYLLQGDDVGAVRFSVGYSLSDIADPLMTELITGGQGVFFRLEGML